MFEIYLKESKALRLLRRKLQWKSFKTLQRQPRSLYQMPPLNENNVFAVILLEKVFVATAIRISNKKSFQLEVVSSTMK
ncbi:CLUMA_CG008670, isoform A [Clunio marinus]|uniref:CLUMA_CG008670, isoform A n=1 Tax=Clunio marinus TaxID=568069 RepID=A0A1J1I4R1_9DIPT|nr:CLUMA_CG008670, isoform A [Clunio marinus]